MHEGPGKGLFLFYCVCLSPCGKSSCCFRPLEIGSFQLQMIFRLKIRLAFCSCSATIRVCTTWNPTCSSVACNQLHLQKGSLQDGDACQCSHLLFRSLLFTCAFAPSSFSLINRSPFGRFGRFLMGLSASLHQCANSSRSEAESRYAARMIVERYTGFSGGRAARTGTILFRVIPMGSIWLCSVVGMPLVQKTTNLFDQTEDDIPVKVTEQVSLQHKGGRTKDANSIPALYICSCKSMTESINGFLVGPLWPWTWRVMFISVIENWFDFVSFLEIKAMTSWGIQSLRLRHFCSLMLSQLSCSLRRESDTGIQLLARLTSFPRIVTRRPVQRASLFVAAQLSKRLQKRNAGENPCCDLSVNGRDWFLSLSGLGRTFCLVAIWDALLTAHSK